MVTVEALLKVRGDVRKIFDLGEGEVNWSDHQEWLRWEVLKGLSFYGFRVSQVEIGLNFVACEFTQCTFQNLRTDAHFWGARDTWERCTFEDCRLTGMIAPINSFRDCRFEKLWLQNFRPHQTLFAGTIFSNCTIQGLRAHTIRNSQIINPDIDQSRGQLVFRNCSFESVEFHQCYFEEVIFEQCIFHQVTAEECSFDGVISDTVWWRVQQTDPFTAFLTKALDLIRQRCGPQSAAYREFENYVIDYGSGRNTSQDFSACLYNNRVPYAETQKFIEELRKLVESHPF